MQKPKIAFYRNKIRPSDNEIKIYLDILDYNSIPYILIDSSEPDLWSKLDGIDYFVFKWGHDHHSRQIAVSILPVLENAGVKCFPNYSTCWHYDDKVKQYLLLNHSEYPAVDSYVFWDKEQALQWIESYNEFPLVFKLRGGAGSLSVFLVKTKRKAKKLVKRMFGKGLLQDTISLGHLSKTLNYDIRKIFRYYAINFRNKYISPEKKSYWLRHKNYAYFQHFMPNNQWDTRVTTAGLRAHAFRRFNRPNDFRASGSNKWDIAPENIDIRMVRIALDVSKHFGFQAMAYDFVYDANKEPRIIEMSYLYGGAGYPDFMNGYWDDQLNWHEGRFWPQHFELMDLLGMPNLKLPDLDTTTSYKKAKIN